MFKGIDKSKLSPMMNHYVSIKEAHPDCIIMYRLGDFYEMFFDDAEVASRVLELALTGRDCGLEERAPMCGVPQQAIEAWMGKLVAAGYKVAIVEQMEDPAEATGLVRRAVTRIVTPGTITDASVLSRAKNNYLLSVLHFEKNLGICFADISTGEINVAELSDCDSVNETLLDWISTFNPSEMLYMQSGSGKSAELGRFEKRGMFVTVLDSPMKDIAQAAKRLEQYLPKHETRKLRKHLFASISTVNLFDYVYRFQEAHLQHLNTISWIEPKDSLKLNAATRENLEIDHNLENHTERNSLLWVLNDTVTAMGSRQLHRWLELPLINRSRIERRLDSVDYLCRHAAERMKLRVLLDEIYDLERLLSKLTYNRGNARDLLSLAQSLKPVPEIKALLMQVDAAPLREIGEALDELEDIRRPIEAAIVDDPPLTINEGGLIRPGFDEALDRIKFGGEQAKIDLVAYEQSQREMTGIKTLKITFKKNVGYFIEVTKSHLNRVPEAYRRRQTLKNAERFTTEELERLAAVITGGEQEINELEHRIFQSIRECVAEASLRIQQTAHHLAVLDVLQSLAKVAQDYGYVRPSFNDDDTIHMVNGRHPVVERSMREPFIPNDLEIGSKDNRIQIITGPNMAGKSTYMRQNALIILMAQIGSFVPCDRCDLCITDQIFTRIGASDNLWRGDSTFMVEMKEMASILEKATSRSFLVLDEVGRGTSTNDGLSIAYAIVEHLSEKLKAKALFATHYHELTVLAKSGNNITNRKVDIAEQDGHLIFLRKVIEGQADKSYGIEVAKLSGLPTSILERANYILSNIDQINDVSFVAKAKTEPQRQQGFSDFKKDALLRSIQQLDLDAMSPLEALNTLSRLRESADRIFED